MLELLLLSKKGYSMREIERELKISVSAVKREIDNLMVLSIVKKEHGKYVADERCLFLDSLIDIFIKTGSFKSLFEEKLDRRDILFVFVFGSFANNSFTNESDVDLFVVGNVGLSVIVKLIKPIERNIGREVNPIVWGIDKLKKEKGKSFIKDIAKNKILMINGDENELRKIIGRRKD